MYNLDNVDTHLEHFGKPGMKWGQRTIKPSTKKNVKKAATIAVSSAAGAAIANKLLKGSTGKMRRDNAIAGAAIGAYSGKLLSDKIFKKS
jgi:hypothetical protein